MLEVMAFILGLFFAGALPSQDVHVDSAIVKSAIDRLTHEILDNCVYECDVTFTFINSAGGRDQVEMKYDVVRSGTELVVDVTSVLPKEDVKHQIAVTSGSIPVRVYYTSEEGRNKAFRTEGLPRLDTAGYLAFALQGTALNDILDKLFPTGVSIKELARSPVEAEFKNNTATFKTEYGVLTLGFISVAQTAVLESVSLRQGSRDRFSNSSSETLAEITSEHRTLPGSKDGLTASEISLQLSYNTEEKSVSLSRLKYDRKLFNANGHIALQNDLRVRKYVKLNRPEEVRARMIALANGTVGRLLGEKDDAKIQAIWNDGSVVRVVDGSVIEAIPSSSGSSRNRIYLALGSLLFVLCAGALAYRRYSKAKP